MDYAKPSRADALAAQYVAGTLRGPARRRFEGLLPSHPSLRQAMQRWEERIVPMALGVEPQEPPARVWAAIEARLFGARSGRGEASRRGTLGFWRTLTALCACMAIALAVVAFRPRATPAPIVVVLAAPAAPGAATGSPLPASFVASFIGNGPLVIRPLLPVNLSPDRALQLWAIPTQGAPRSLGLIATAEPTTIAGERIASDVTALAVSVEPPGGSPTGAPTGPVILTGALRS